MVSVRVVAKVFEDNTGVASEIPVLFTADGELSLLTDYLLHLQVNGRSKSTLDNVVRAVALFLDYMDANADAFVEPERLFRTFVSRLYSGTVSEEGLDPSGLYWLPASDATTKGHINAITGFTDWLADKHGTAQINPLRKATNYEEYLNYAAWFRKNQNDFLGHIADKSISTTVKRARKIKGRTPLVKSDDDAIAFPNSRFEEFFAQGIGGAKDPRVSLRDKLILLLMHGAGLRLSEAMTLWVTDVLESPGDPKQALVRIYSEREGVAPHGWRGRNGDRTRKAYLAEEFGRRPRCDMQGTQHLGFKATALDHRDGYLIANWFPTDYGRLFMLLWSTYLKYRAAADANNPYAWVSFHNNAMGRPYTINAFNQNYAAGLRRIGLSPNKSEGLDPHGHRHNYGRRLTRAGIDPLIIKKCLHHRSLGSQMIYTTPGAQEISDMLTIASEALLKGDAKVHPIDWGMLIDPGFDEMDSQRLYADRTRRIAGS